jgi:hypothetical protein
MLVIAMQFSKAAPRSGKELEAAVPAHKRERDALPVLCRPVLPLKSKAGNRFPQNRAVNVEVDGLRWCRRKDNRGRRWFR